MAVQTYTIRNSVDGKFDTYHVNPAVGIPQPITAIFAADTATGTGNGKRDSNRDSSRDTAETR